MAGVPKQVGHTLVTHPSRSHITNNNIVVTSSSVIDADIAVAISSVSAKTSAVYVLHRS